MAKLRDFLRKKAEVALIKDTDLEALLSSSAMAEIELPDSFITKFDESYLTRTRAANDSEIVSEIQKKTRAQVLNKTDEILERFYSLIPNEKAIEIGKLVGTERKIYPTYERMEKLEEALKEELKKTSTKVSEDVQKVEAEWAGKYKTLQEQAKAEKTSILEGHRQEKIDGSIKTKLLGFKIADSFQSIKEPIIQNIVTKVKNLKHNNNPVVFEIADNGDVVLRQSVDGTLRDIYMKGDEKLTLDKLLEQEIDPFIVKSNGGGNPGDGAANGANQQRQITKDPTKMTLHEQMWADQAAAQ